MLQPTGTPIRGGFANSNTFAVPAPVSFNTPSRSRFSRPYNRWQPSRPSPQERPRGQRRYERYRRQSQRQPRYQKIEEEEQEEQEEQEEEEEEEVQEDEYEESEEEEVQAHQVRHDVTGLRMCSAEELQRRESSGLLSIFEMQPNTDIDQNPFPKAHVPWVIREYVRTQGDVVKDIRTSHVLQETVDYLCKNIIDLDTGKNPNGYTKRQGQDKHSLQDIIKFVGDRMRAVSKDFKALKDSDQLSFVRNHEIISRFYINSIIEGLECEDVDFKLILNSVKDALVTCLQDKYKTKQKEQYPNELEFLSYIIILTLPSQIETQMCIKSIGKAGLQYPMIQLALRAFVAYQTNNFQQYFQIAKESPYLLNCMMYIHYDAVRIKALGQILRVGQQVKLSDVQEVLGFSDTDEIFEYLQRRNIYVSIEDQDIPYIQLTKGEEISTVFFRPQKAPQKILGKRLKEYKSRYQMVYNTPNVKPTKDKKVVQIVQQPKQVIQPPPQPIIQPVLQEEVKIQMPQPQIQLKVAQEIQQPIVIEQKQVIPQIQQKVEVDVEKVIQQKKRNSFEFPDSLHMVKKLVKHKKAKKLRKNIKKYKKKEV